MTNRIISQTEIIKRVLIEKKSVNNVSSFKGEYDGKPILRLGAIIHRLRTEQDMFIETTYENKEGFRNCHYKLIK